MGLVRIVVDKDLTKSQIFVKNNFYYLRLNFKGPQNFLISN